MIEFNKLNANNKMKSKYLVLPNAGIKVLDEDKLFLNSL